MILVGVAGLFGSTDISENKKLWDLTFEQKAGLGGLAIAGFFVTHFRTKSKLGR